ncbi:MAG TPA: PAS domain S-box protein [Lacunisphaera sp.]|jgi:PAS domain S-box-containing protein|nr:PAS domain S-box protein [Lacunisphaera sp.]
MTTTTELPPRFATDLAVTPPATSDPVPESPGFCAVFFSADELRPAGWPRAGTVGALCRQEDFRARVQPLIRRCLLEGRPHHAEMARDLPGHGRRCFDLSLAPLQLATGRQAVLFIRDVTGRERTENNLQQLLQMIHLLSTAPDLAGATSAILRVLCVVFSWARGEVWIPNPAGAVELLSAINLPDHAAAGPFHELSSGLALGVDSPQLASIWAGEPAFVPDLAADAGFFRAEAAARAGFNSALVIPLRAAERTIGLLVLFQASREAPDGHRLMLAHAVGVQLGAVFQRHRLQEQVDSFFTRSLDLHCLVGFDGYLKRVNPAWSRSLGHPEEELLRRPLADFIHPEDRPAFLAMLTRIGAGENLQNVEVRCLKQDEEPLWTAWTATALPKQHLLIATCRDITERKRIETAMLQSEEHYRDLFHQAYQMQEGLRQLSDRLLRVQEHERSRISRDLHDEVGQALTAINMNLAILRNSLDGAAPEVLRRIGDTQQLIEQTMGTIHNFSRELRPAMLDDLGLLPTLRNYVKSFGERTGIVVQFHATQPAVVETFDSECKTVVYRIVQESLNNVAKHAAATRVEIVVAGSPQEIRLQVGDDGRGFAASAQPASERKQLGLLGLAERVRLVGGDFAIASRPGRGTIIRATIPFRSV